MHPVELNLHFIQQYTTTTPQHYRLNLALCAYRAGVVPKSTHKHLSSHPSVQI